MGGSDLGNYNITAQGTTTANITAKALTIGGITAANKTYDGDTSATIDVSAATFTGLVEGDNVTVSATGVFSDKDVDTNKTVTLTETNGGDDVGNYSNYRTRYDHCRHITAKALTIGGITAANKTYDGDTSATIDVSAATFTGLVEGDDVTVSATGVFSDKDVDTNKTVTLTETNGGDDVGNYTITAQGTTTADITQKDLTVSGITASNKVYDSTTSATVDDGSVVFTGLVEGDDLTISTTGVFNNEHVGTQTVTLTETMGGSDLGNYNITAQGTTTADITAKAITISGITASNKVYDSTTSATLDVDSIAGFIAGDDVSISAITGTFADEHVDTDIAVSFSNITYAGSDKDNYTITDQAGTTADITQKDLTVSGITASNKVYDSTTSATVDDGSVVFTGLVEGDDLTISTTGVFNNEHVGTQTVTLTETMGGSDLGNYNITAQGTTTADITAKAITISGITASNKVYDSTTSATLDVDSIAGFIAGDDVSISAITGTFADEHVDTDIAVSFSNITYAGSDKDNYTITDQAGTTADITQKDLTVSGITASNKVYDSTTSATVDDGSVVFTGLVEGDDLTISTTGVFNNEHVGTQL